MKKIFFTILLMFSLYTNINALDINSSNVIMYNLNEDKVIYEKDSNQKISIASLTKIMTTIVAIENIENLDAKIIIQSRDFTGLYEADASVAGFVVGEEVTYRDLLYGTFLPSGAEATQALAYNLTGSIDDFVGLMNKKAQELNLENTHFANTTGLDDEQNYSTVKDVATILKYALKNETFKEIYEANSYIASNGKHAFYSSFRYTAARYNYNVNKIIGAKTGYTDNAGKCLASTAYDDNNDILYMLVTCGASVETDDAYHVKDSFNIYNYYFDNYKYQDIIKENELLVSIKAKYGKENYVNIYAKEPVLYYLNNDYDTNKVSIKYDGLKTIDYHNKKGEKIGEVQIFYDNELVDNIDINLNDEYKFSIINFLLQTNIIYVVIGLFVLLIIFIICKRKKKN